MLGQVLVGCGEVDSHAGDAGWRAATAQGGAVACVEEEEAPMTCKAVALPGDLGLKPYPHPVLLMLTIDHILPGYPSQVPVAASHHSPALHVLHVSPRIFVIGQVCVSLSSRGKGSKVSAEFSALPCPSTAPANGLQDIRPPPPPQKSTEIKFLSVCQLQGQRVFRKGQQGSEENNFFLKGSVPLSIL